MSNYSSEEELGDSLQIKPPQLRPKIRTDRPHRRERTREHFAESRQNRQPGFHRRDEAGTYEGSRRREQEYGVPRRIDEGFVDRSSRYQHGHGQDRNSFRAHASHDRSESRIPKSGAQRYDMPPRDDSRQLQKHKKKRKHAEEEEERVFREIEKRRERERRREQGRVGSNEESGSSGSGRRSKQHRQSVPSPKSRSRGSAPQSENEEMLDLTVSDDDVQNLLPRIEVDDPPSHSEEEEEGQHTPSSEASDNGKETKRKRAILHEDRDSNAASDISSDSERKEDRSDSSKSKEESGSDDSESDSSNSAKVKQTKPGKSSSNGKLSRENQSEGSPKSISDISDRSGDEQDQSHEIDGPIPLEKETVGAPEVKVEEPVEREMTEVEKACQELDLLPPYYPSIQGCRRVEEFSLLNRIEEGTYGVVYRAKDKRTNEVVALKRLKMEKEKDGFPITSLREINTLLKAQHENIVTVREIVVGSNTDKIFLVMDYVEHDLKSLMETLKQKKQEFIMGEVKCLLIQLLRAVAHLHDNWILHRDLKTSNLLLSHKGILKVGDFGLAREYGSPLKPYTPIVVTLWYRAPELLLGAKEYSTPIDVWSTGCIFGELLKMEPMFPGKSEANQLNLIFQTLGTPNDKIWSGYSKMPLLQKMTFGEYPVNKLKTRFGILSDTGIDLMNKFLTYNPSKRITAEEALNHSFFREAPLPIDPSIFPTWPAKSEGGLRKHASPKPPSGGRQFKDLKEDDSVGFFLGAGDRRPPMGAGFSLKF